MQENKRQKQIAGLINEEMVRIFQHLGLNMINNAMVSISSVKVTPDLLEARIYLSIFNATDPKAALKKIEDKLASHFSTKVKLRHSKDGSGAITFEYYSLEEMNKLLDQMNVTIE